MVQDIENEKLGEVLIDKLATFLELRDEELRDSKIPLDIHRMVLKEESEIFEDKPYKLGIRFANYKITGYDFTEEFSMGIYGDALYESDLEIIKDQGNWRDGERIVDEGIED